MTTRRLSYAKQYRKVGQWVTCASLNRTKVCLTPARPRAPSAREATGGNPGSRGLDARQLHPREQEDRSKNRVKLVFSADAGRVKDGPERILTSVAQERKRILDVCCPEQWGAQIWRACSHTDLDSKCIT